MTDTSEIKDLTVDFNDSKIKALTVGFSDFPNLRNICNGGKSKDRTKLTCRVYSEDGIDADPNSSLEAVLPGFAIYLDQANRSAILDGWFQGKEIEADLHEYEEDSWATKKLTACRVSTLQPENLLGYTRTNDHVVFEVHGVMYKVHRMRLVFSLISARKAADLILQHNPKSTAQLYLGYVNFCDSQQNFENNKADLGYSKNERNSQNIQGYIQVGLMGCSDMDTSDISKIEVQPCSSKTIIPFTVVH